MDHKNQNQLQDRNQSGHDHPGKHRSGWTLKFFVVAIRVETIDSVNRLEVQVVQVNKTDHSRQPNRVLSDGSLWIHTEATEGHDSPVWS